MMMKCTGHQRGLSLKDDDNNDNDDDVVDEFVAAETLHVLFLLGTDPWKI